MPEEINQLLSHLAAGVVGGLSVALANHFLTKDRENRKDKRLEAKAEKQRFMDLINRRGD